MQDNTEKPYVLVIDDQPGELGALFDALEEAGHNLLIAQSGAEAMNLLVEISPDVILLDVNLPEMNGFEVCRQLKQAEATHEIPILFITAAVNLDDKLNGFKAGGADYIVKPFQLAEVLARVGAHLTIHRLRHQARQLESENVILKATLHNRDHLGELKGRSPVMQKMYERLLKAALSDAPVIIYGETGTGKELAARTIRQLSEARNRVFVSINCAAVQASLFEAQFFGHRKGAFTGATQNEPGYFDQARGGVLFLDEVSELPLELQAKLLRVLNNGEYMPVGETRPLKADVRIISATNKQLREEVTRGRFREDLFYRLHVISLEMPPLRRHKEDLPLLISHLLEEMDPDGKVGRKLPDEILATFRRHDWPGNVRELANQLRRYVALGEVEIEADGASGAPCQGSFQERVAAFERELIAESLARENGNRTRASARLGIPMATLYRKIEKYGL